MHQHFDNNKDAQILRIQDFLDDFLNSCNDKDYCFYYKGDNELNDGISILGKKFAVRTPLKIFVDYLDREMNKYGNKKSNLCKIIKHKAKISHSLLLVLFSRDNYI